MVSLRDKVQNVLDETRTLILGAQIIAQVQLESFFQPGFERLAVVPRSLMLVSLVLMLVAFALLIAPVAYHRIIGRGMDGQHLHDLATRMTVGALFPFAVGIAVDLYIVTEKLSSTTAGLLAGIAGLVLALYFWYILELFQRQRRVKLEIMDRSDETMSLKDRVRHVMTEARVVIPGAQASLGFQFVAVLTDAFERLSQSLQYVHLAALVLTALAVILLMAPVAYHRIVERGEDSDQFHAFAGRMVIVAMLPLALGLCADLFVVSHLVLDSSLSAGIVSGAMLLLFMLLWLVLPLLRRRSMARGTAIQE